MTSLSPRGKKERLLRVFKRTGGSGSGTGPFDSFPQVVQERVRSEAGLNEGEEPILFSYHDDDHWTLLTSEKLIAKQASVATHLAWAEIVDATIDLHALQRALAKSGKQPASGKLNLQHLRVMRSTGAALEVELEAGPSFIAFWNVLKTVAGLKRM